MAKTDTIFMTKAAENHTLWRCTYLATYNAHIREYPPGNQSESSGLPNARGSDFGWAHVLAKESFAFLI